MKVITEERLIEILDQYDDTWMIKDELIKECRELDQLTVTRLRPMSEIPMEDGSAVLVKGKREDHFMMAFVLKGDLVDEYSNSFNTNGLEGFIPAPIYKPEQS